MQDATSYGQLIVVKEIKRALTTAHAERPPSTGANRVSLTSMSASS